jgi:U3 small nucleolar RNA-associated protein 25
MYIIHRYAIRGIRNLIFYSPPDHAQFYTEFLSYPFLDDGVEATDLTCRLLYGKYDFFAVERIVGSESVAEVMKGT